MLNSNGFHEATIGRIKKIKNTAYGFRNLTNFTNRIKLQMLWFRPTQVTWVKRNKKAPRPISA
ncbi:MULTISPECIES: transposase [Lactobacillaceae]|uniref:transposase n=1 Tax=Lactobacillaceae TaxID=33958 RepID=UPI001C5D2B0C|nr:MULTISPECIES: transposase [Lactobacillaceae]MBW4802119.1 transposase [Loigolactobacillus coryniformis subsp. torquens]MBW4806378.1 transposase [Loigolactobacillus coryniformis subsp. torquens]WQE70388.1 transposase [Lactiplantibacillus plantarum]